jgi:hypothetical protein
MEESQRTGVLLLCVFCNLPLALGAFLGWKIRGRIVAYGWPWGLFPKKLRQLLQEAAK